MRWLMALAAWGAPNILLMAAIVAIPPSPEHPMSPRVMWASGTFVVLLFLSVFCGVGYLSIRLARRFQPESAVFGLLLGPTVMLLAFLSADRELVGPACLAIWGFGQILGSLSRPYGRST